MLFVMRRIGVSRHIGRDQSLVVSSQPTYEIRPKEFVKVSSYEESDDEESTVGKMPPSDNSDSE